MPGSWINKRPGEPELKKILEDHKTWLYSRGQSGVRAVLREARLAKSALTKVDLRVADLNKAFLAKANLMGAHLTKAFLRESDLTGAVLTEADLRGADLKGAVMRAAVLRAARLEEADLKDADLTGADLTGADLSGADLQGADLTGADLTIAMLKGADLRGANLTEVDLRGADLTRADLREARLEGVDLALTQRQDTRISDSESLNETKGLEDVIGFVFEQEPIADKPAQEQQQAPVRSSSPEMNEVTIRFPESYGPAQLAQMLVYLTMMNEGLRLILTTPFHDLKDLLNEFTRPEIFNQFQDEHSLKLVPFQARAIDAVMKGRKGGRLLADAPVDYNAPELWRKSYTTENLQKQQEVIKQGLNDVMPILQSENIPQTTKSKAAKVVEKYLDALEGVADKISKKEVKVDAALTAYLYTINKIEKMSQQMGGLEIINQDGETLLGRQEQEQEQEDEFKTPTEE